MKQEVPPGKLVGVEFFRRLDPTDRSTGAVSGLRQKTFWWSGAWSPGDEPIPAITVIGVRLDGAGTFESGPGTNASADFGTAMLVGVEFPAPGCWRLTAAYRDVELSYVVLVTDE